MKVGIGLSGKAGSGKTTIAKEFIKVMLTQSGLTVGRISFADKLKGVCSELFPQLLVGPKESHRWVYKKLGLAMRSIDRDVWVRCALRQSAQYEVAVIDDLRFQNEAEMLREQGFVLVRIQRDQELRKSYGYRIHDLHVSEQAIDDYNFDYCLKNDGPYPFTEAAKELYLNVFLRALADHHPSESL